jgi:hypothetical protein
MPLDAKPEKRVVLIDAETGIPYVTIPGPPTPTMRAVVVDTYVSHFSTCPDSQKWKGRRRGAA